MEVRVSPQVDDLLKLSRDLKEYEDGVRSGKITTQDVAVSGRTSIEENMKNKVAEIMLSGVNENDIKAIRDIVASLPDGDQRQAMKMQLKVLEAKFDDKNQQQEENNNKTVTLSGSDNSKKSANSGQEKEASEFYEQISKNVEVIQKATIGAFNEAGEMVDYAKANIVQVSKDSLESVMTATRSLLKIFENIGIETIVQENKNSDVIAFGYKMPKGFENLNPTQMSQQDLEKILQSQREKQSQTAQENKAASTQESEFVFNAVGSASKEDLMASFFSIKAKAIAKEILSKANGVGSNFPEDLFNLSVVPENSELTNALKKYAQNDSPDKQNSNQR